MIHDFDLRNQEGAKKTYRSWTHNVPICYRLLLSEHIATDGKRILDYGCGPEEKYVKQMKALKLNAAGVDFHIEGSRDKHLGNGKLYDIITISNVLNVMDNLPDLKGVLQEIAHHLTPQGIAIANYPAAPRKLGISNKELTSLLEEYFNIAKPEKAIIKSNLVFLLTLKT